MPSVLWWQDHALVLVNRHPSSCSYPQIVYEHKHVHERVSKREKAIIIGVPSEVDADRAFEAV